MMNKEQIEKALKMIYSDDENLRTLGATILINGLPSEKLREFFLEEPLYNPANRMPLESQLYFPNTADKNNILYRKGDWGLVYFRGKWIYAPIYKLVRLRGFDLIRTVEV